MRKYNSTDAPLFLRAGIDRNDVKVLDNQKDFDNFKTTVGISFNGYGFAQNETILIPDLPVVATKEGEKAMKIISIPSYEGADENHRTYLLEVERERDGVKSKSWLNLNRLVDRSFVDQKYPDDFREEMATKFSSHYERLCYLRGGKIVSDGTTEVQRYKFGTDRAIVLDDEGNRVLDTPGTVTTVTFEAKKAARANA